MNGMYTTANEPTIHSLMVFLGVIGIVLCLLTVVDYFMASPTHNAQTQCYQAVGQGMGFYIPLGWVDTRDMLDQSPSVMYFCAEIKETGELDTSITRPMPKGAELINIPRYAQDPHTKILTELNQANSNLGQFRDLVQRQNTSMQQMYNYIQDLERELDKLNQPGN